MKEIKKILFIDDEPDIVEIYSLELEDSGYEVIEAHSGDQGLEILNNTDDIDLVISDLNMPNGSGIDLIKKVNSEDVIKYPFIFTTGYSDSEMEDIKKLGVIAILTKPLAPSALVDCIEKIKNEAA